jgi:hypothetical protein
VADYDDRHPGDGLVNLCFAGTGTLVGTSLAATLLPDAFGIVHAAVSGLLFAVGTGALLWAYALGVSRSRAVEVTLAGLFFLAGGAAPPDVARRFRIALAVQVVVVVAAAAATFSRSPWVPFGVLAPMFGLGLMSVYGGRFGVFTAKADGARDADRGAS